VPSLPKTVWRLSWVSFFADISSEVIYPLLPIYITGFLGAPKVILGLVEGVAEGVVSFFKGWSGVHSDVYGARLPYVQAGYGLSALGKPALAIAAVWPVALAARVVDRIGKGVRTTARDALIADVTPKALWGAAFGLHRALDTAGALVGVALLACVIALLPPVLTWDQYKLIFLLAGVPGIISVIITFTVREPEQRHDGASKPKAMGAAVRGLPKRFWLALIPFAAFGIANSSDGFLLMRAKELGFTTFQTILVYALYNVSYMALAYPVGKLSDRIGRTPIIAAGWLLYAGVYAAFTTTILAWLPVIFFFYGVFRALTQATSASLVAHRAPPELKGTAMGAFHFTLGFATIAGNLATGLLWDRYGAKTALPFCAGLAALATGAFLFAPLRDPPAQQQA